MMRFKGISMAHKLLKGVPAGAIIGLYIFLIFDISMSMAETGNTVEQNKILVIGTGLIADGNLAKAREAAISEALVRGTEEYLTRRLGSQGMINNFPRLLQEVLTRAREQIENFHILAEEQIDRHYKILVRVKINEKVMEEKLRQMGLILMETHPIKILFLVSQLETQKGRVAYWWKDPESDSGLTPTELALHRIFQERGFRPISRLLNVPEEDYPSEMKDLNLSDEDALRWGRVSSADVVVHGRCEISEGKEVSVTLLALDVGKGIMIHMDTQIERIEESPGSMEQIMQTVEKAINKIAVKLSPAMIRAIEMPEPGLHQLEVTLKGLRNFRQFRDIRDFLERDIKGVKSVKQTGVRGNVISLMVEFSGDESRFLDMVSTHENMPFEADVTRSEEGKIIINIRQSP